MIEINANPHRLDLDATHCRRARQKGVTIVDQPRRALDRRAGRPGLRHRRRPPRGTRAGPTCSTRPRSGRSPSALERAGDDADRCIHDVPPFGLSCGGSGRFYNFEEEGCVLRNRSAAGTGSGRTARKRTVPGD